MYSLTDAKRHWKSYLAHVKLIPVASAAASSQSTDRKPSSAGNYCCLLEGFGVIRIDSVFWPDVVKVDQLSFALVSCLSRDSNHCSCVT